MFNHFLLSASNLGETVIFIPGFYRAAGSGISGKEQTIKLQFRPTNLAYIFMCKLGTGELYYRIGLKFVINCFFGHK